MGDSTFDKSASVYVSVKPEHIVAATMPGYRNQKLELYKNSDIAPNGCLYIETPHGDRILRQPTLQGANPDHYTLFLRKTDATGRVLFPATRDNTAVYMTGVRDYTEARELMANFEEHAEKIRLAHEQRAARESFSRVSTSASANRSGSDPSQRVPKAKQAPTPGIPKR